MDNHKPGIVGADQQKEEAGLTDLGVEESHAESVKGGTQTRQSSVVVDM